MVYDYIQGNIVPLNKRIEELEHEVRKWKGIAKFFAWKLQNVAPPLDKP